MVVRYDVFSSKCKPRLVPCARPNPYLQIQSTKYVCGLAKVMWAPMYVCPIFALRSVKLAKIERGDEAMSLFKHGPDC